MAEDSGRSNPIKGVVEGVKGVAKQAVGAVAGQKYLVREGKAQAAQASGYIPGAPSSASAGHQTSPRPRASRYRPSRIRLRPNCARQPVRRSKGPRLRADSRTNT